MFYIELIAPDGRPFKFQEFSTMRLAREGAKLQNHRRWAIRDETGAELDNNLKFARRQKASDALKAKNEALRDLGIVKVRGALGGTYYE